MARLDGLRNVSQVREITEGLLDHLRNRDRVMMMLGPFMFSIGTAAPQEMRRTNTYEWPSQGRIGRNPVRMMTAFDERIELSGTIYPAYKGGLRQVAVMRGLAGTGRRWLLVDGTGVVYGLFAIVRIEEVGTRHLDNGAARRIDFRLELEYAGDR